MHRTYMAALVLLAFLVSAAPLSAQKTEKFQGYAEWRRDGVLGHELAHYTHEHSRRSAKRAMGSQIITVSAAAALETVYSEKARALATLGALLSLTAWQTG